MTGKIFFCAEDVQVSSLAIMVDGCALALEQFSGARTRRIGRWFWESYEVILFRQGEGEISLLRHRNAYFAYQLARAIEAALGEQRAAERAAALTA